MSRIQGLTGRAVETLEDFLGAMEGPFVRLGEARTVAENQHAPARSRDYPPETWRD